MKNVIKNKKVIIIAITVLVVILLGIIIFFFKNNSSNKLKGEVFGFGKVAHPSFSDPFLYGCVVESYNQENNTSYNHDDVLTNEQLASIKKLDCFVNDYINFFLPRSEYANRFDIDNLEYKFDQNSFQSELEMSYIMSKYHNPKNQYSDDFAKVSYFDGFELLTNISEMYVLVDVRENIYKDEIKQNELLLPDSLKKMMLYTAGSSSDNKLNIKNAKNVEELEILDDNGDSVVFLDSLSNLKILKGTANLNIEELINLEEAYFVEPDDNYDSFGKLPKLTTLSTLGGVTSARNKISSELMEKLSYFDMYIRAENIPEPKDGKYYNLKSLSIDGNASDFDLSLFPNLEYLVISTNFCSLNEFSGLESLSSLKHLYISKGSHNCNIDISLIEKLENLETLIIESYYSTKTITANLEKESKIKNLILPGTLNDYSKFTNLDNLYIDSNNTISETKLKNIIEQITANGNIVDNLYLTVPIVFENVDWEKNINVKGFYGSNIPNKMLSKMELLETLYLYRTWNNNYYEKKLDFGNNHKLKNLYVDNDINTYASNIPFDAPLEEVYAAFEECIDIGIFPNLKVFVSEDTDCINNSNSSNQSNLFALIIGNEIHSESGLLDLSKAYNLEMFGVGGLSETTVDISNSNRLRYFGVENEVVNSGLGILNEKVDIEMGLIMPKHYNIIPENDEVLEYLKIEGGEIFIVKKGTTQFEYKVSIDRNGLAESSGIYYIMSISSNKMKITNDGYILTNELKKEKDIIEDFSTSFVPGISFVGVIDKNIFKLMYNGNVFKNYDLIKVTSSKYVIDKENIYYNGSFNADLVKATNAIKNLNGDKLEIIYNDKIVKTYNLIRKDNMVGDVNGDGKISITDMTMQYKHVKYVLDLEGDEEYRADLNSDDDVTITDVTSLYKTIKGSEGE